MPRIGRFLQTDPMGFEDSMNLYQGFGMNPVNNRDPFGLQSLGSWFPNHPYNKKFPGSRSVFQKVETGFKGMYLTSRRVGVSVANATVGNAVNVVIFLATANPLGWAAGERPALVFYSNDDPFSTQLVSGKFMMVDAKPLEDLKNATVVIPMVERTVDYMKNMSSDSPESAEYCMLNVVQFGMDLYCLSEMGGGLLNLNKGKIIQQYKNESGGTVSIVKYDPVDAARSQGKITIDSINLNYSQRSVSSNVYQYALDMKNGLWDWAKSGFIRIMKRDGKWVTYDNRRVLASELSGKGEVPFEVVNPYDIMPGSKKTWEVQYIKRFSDPRNAEAGGVVPNSGIDIQPKVIIRKK